MHLRARTQRETQHEASESDYLECPSAHAFPLSPRIVGRSDFYDATISLANSIHMSLATCKQVLTLYVKMVRKKAAQPAVGCSLYASVEMPRGRKSLLIIRDMMLQGARAYKTFLECYEGIATNILADRLRKHAWGVGIPRAYGSRVKN